MRLKATVRDEPDKGFKKLRTKIVFQLFDTLMRFAV
jgi:hypothetical protein